MTEKHILVIDDENSVRKIIHDNLELSGFRVAAAASGEEGLAMIDVGPVPGLVITDIVMPGKSGLEVIKETRKKYPSVRIIAMSGGGRIEEVQDLLEKATELGADAVLPKPLNLDHLESTVEKLLG
jgi:DNA-binding NtrC family response regulator